jgi:hypothetical protein
MADSTNEISAAQNNFQPSTIEVAAQAVSIDHPVASSASLEVKTGATTSNLALEQLKVEQAGLTKAIGAIICLIVGFFFAGFIFGAIAANLGWKATKVKNVGIKVLGGICTAVGVMYIIISIIAFL